MLTDTHCHLYYEELFKDLAGVLDRAHEQGVNRFICVGTNIQDSKKSLSITENHDSIFASTGVHPHDAKDVSESFIDDIYKNDMFRSNNYGIIYQEKNLLHDEDFANLFYIFYSIDQLLVFQPYVLS